MIDRDPKRPGYRRPESVAALPDLELCADLVAGTRRMHEKAVTYVRKWPSEDTGVYAYRSTCEDLYEGYARVLNASTGLLFGQPPVLSGSDAALATIAPDWENIDRAGTHGEVFARRAAYLALRDGYSVILVDHPPRPEGVVTRADAARVGLRPAWALYERSHVLSWHTSDEASDVLTMLTLLEPTSVPNGYGVEERAYVRELRVIDGIATWRLIDITDDADGVEVDSGVFRDRTGRPFGALPVAIVYGGSDVPAPLVTRPPLMGVAWSNLSHYQISSELRFYSSVSSYPQPTIEGRLQNDPNTGRPMALEMGPLVVVNVSEGSSFRWTEISGASATQLAARVADKLAAMASQGLAFLTGESVNKTATQTRLETAGQTASLQTAARGIADGLNAALAYHAQYYGIAAMDAPVITLSVADDGGPMDAAVMGAIGSLVREGLPTLYAAKLLQAGGRLPADADPVEIALDWDAARLSADNTPTTN